MAEWALVTAAAADVLDADQLDDLSPDGNPDSHVGVALEDVVIYGHPSDVLGWARSVATQVAAADGDLPVVVSYEGPTTDERLGALADGDDILARLRGLDLELFARLARVLEVVARCTYCGRGDLRYEACPNAKDLCTTCCGDH